MSCILFVTSEAGSPKHHRGAPHSQELITTVSLDFWVVCVLLLHGLIARERFGLFFCFCFSDQRKDFVRNLHTIHKYSLFVSVFLILSFEDV